MSAHEEHNALLEDKDRVKDDEWFDEIDIQVFSFKRKVACWLKNAEKRAYQKGHLEVPEPQLQKQKRSKTLKESRSSRGSKSSEEKGIEGKFRVAELAAEAELLEQKQILNVNHRS